MQYLLIVFDVCFIKNSKQQEHTQEYVPGYTPKNAAIEDKITC